MKFKLVEALHTYIVTYKDTHDNDALLRTEVEMERKATDELQRLEASGLLGVPLDCVSSVQCKSEGTASYVEDEPAIVTIAKALNDSSHTETTAKGYGLTVEKKNNRFVLKHMNISNGITKPKHLNSLQSVLRYIDTYKKHIEERTQR